MSKDERRRDQALRRALKRCPGRDAIEVVRSVAILAAETGDAEGAEVLDRVVEVLLDLRMAAHGGTRMAVPRHWDARLEVNDGR